MLNLRLFSVKVIGRWKAVFGHPSLADVKKALFLGFSLFQDKAKKTEESKDGAPKPNKLTAGEIRLQKGSL